MRFLLPLLLCSLFISCIGDDYVNDYVQPELRITNVVDSIAIDSSYQFEISYFNNVGVEEAVGVNWTSSAENTLSIDLNGLATAHAFGPVAITASYLSNDIPVEVTVDLHTSENPVEPPVLENRSGDIRTTSSYQLEGAFLIEELAGGGIRVRISEDYRADVFLPGLYLYLTNNPSTSAGALEVAEVEVFSGAHTYEIPDIGINDYSHLLYYCKPFNVKVGDGIYNQ